MRLCTRCETEKPMAEFGRDATRHDQKRKWCRSCIRKYGIARRETMPDETKDKINLTRRLRRAEYPGRDRAWERMRTPAQEQREKMMGRQHGWKRNGIINADGSRFTLVDYDRAYQVQQGRCRGCLRHQTELRFALSTDHDHATGIFRGLLCAGCNHTLGYARDSIEILDRLETYLLTDRVAQEKSPC